MWWIVVGALLYLFDEGWSVGGELIMAKAGGNFKAARWGY
jgi:hypothetical protein